MEHADHVELLRAAVRAGETWADVGAGRGAFTRALAELIGPNGTLWAVDRDPHVLAENGERIRAMPPGSAPKLHVLVGDFTRPLTLPPLDGIVMANALHFTSDPVPVVRRLAGPRVLAAIERPLQAPLGLLAVGPSVYLRARRDAR